MNPFAFTNASFTNIAGLKKEIFAYGFRNPHRMSWDTNSNTLIANDIGLLSWEEVNIVHKGTNYGYAERDASSGQIYNAVQVIAPDGAGLSHYRKTHLWGPDERAAYHPGSRFEPPFDFGGFKFGLLICYDVEYPEAVRSLALMGADVVLVPTALSNEYAGIPNFVIPARSIENQVFVAYCNHAGVENGMRFLGGSCLTGVDGRALAAAGPGEALIVGEIDRRAREAAAKACPYHADRRPELYGLLTSG